MSARSNITLDFEEYAKVNEGAVPAFEELEFLLACGKYTW